ncbi:MAG: exo-alpha-sialidase [Chloroflexota bacterium]
MRKRSMRPVVIAAVLVLGGLAILAAAITLGGSSSARGVHMLAFTKGEPDAVAKPGNEAYAAGLPEGRTPETAAEQDYANRAYPADTIPFQATLNSQSTFNTLKKHGNKKNPGAWQLIGPDQAKYPALLDQFLAGGKPYVASGRVTAMGIAQNCGEGHCRLYLAAAGGGVWVTDKALHSNPSQRWEFTSGSFLTNAIGSLLVDPSDPSGNTVYAGTGEPNASGDSEAGMGIYKTTDGGDSWVRVAGSEFFQGRAISSLALDNSGNLLAGVARAVRGISSVTGGVTSNPPPPMAAFGVYRQTGPTFTQIWNAPGSIRGVTQVVTDPTHAGIIYASAFQDGVYRSLNNGTTWSQIFAATNPAFNTDRTAFDVNTLPGGATRMYVGEGGCSGNAGRPGCPANNSTAWRSDNADTAATFTAMDPAHTNGYCTGQCWYDNYVVSPPGAPDIAYLGGSFSYGQVHGASNGRAVLLSTNAGSSWSDMTIDSNNDGWIHPDQHALVTIPGSPLQFIAGDDGGLVQSNGKFVDGSGDCAGRGLNPADTAYCQSLLSRIPDQMYNMNKGLSTLQFQSFSVNPSNVNNLQGGTQDNGTFEYSGSAGLWPQIIYGDGGQSGWNAANSNLRFNTFTGQANDVNFRNGDPAYWVVATGPIVSSPESAQFYPPIIADPNPANAGSIFQGSFSIWRTQDWGGNQAFLEANCPEFTTDAGTPACGDFAIIGDGVPSTMLTSATWGTRSGGTVGAIERYAGNSGSLWAATSRGRVFVSDNANAAAAAVHYTRLDNTAANSPGRFISSIYIDPANANHAWISYSGYNFNTPTTPGHVFEVTRTGSTATWVDRTYDLADLPVTDLVFDNVAGDLYAATDFGVWKLASGATSWTVAAPGMPAVETPGLTIVPGARVLYAATHGRGGWKLQLP